MAKKVELTKDQRMKLKKLIGEALSLQAQQKVLAQEYDQTKERIQLIMEKADLETVTTDIAVASYVAGAVKTILNVGKLVAKLSYKEYVSVSAPKLGEVRKLMSAEELAAVSTEETGPAYLTIRQRAVDEAETPD